MFLQVVNRNMARDFIIIKVCTPRSWREASTRDSATRLMYIQVFTGFFSILLGLMVALCEMLHLLQKSPDTFEIAAKISKSGPFENIK